VSRITTQPVLPKAVRDRLHKNTQFKEAFRPAYTIRRSQNFLISGKSSRQTSKFNRSVVLYTENSH